MQLFFASTSHFILLLCSSSKKLARCGCWLFFFLLQSYWHRNVNEQYTFYISTSVNKWKNLWSFTRTFITIVNCLAFFFAAILCVWNVQFPFRHASSVPVDVCPYFREYVLSTFSFSFFSQFTIILYRCLRCAMWIVHSVWINCVYFENKMCSMFHCIKSSSWNE